MIVQLKKTCNWQMIFDSRTCYQTHKEKLDSVRQVRIKLIVTLGSAFKGDSIEGMSGILNSKLSFQTVSRVPATLDSRLSTLDSRQKNLEKKETFSSICRVKFKFCPRCLTSNVTASRRSSTQGAEIFPGDFRIPCFNFAIKLQRSLCAVRTV